MKYAKQVEAALADAAPIEHNEYGLLPVAFEDTATAGAVLSEIGHDYPISFPSQDAFEAPSRVFASGLPDVEKIIAAYDAQVGNKTSIADLEKKLAHEQEHARIVKILGGFSLYGVQFVSDPRTSMVGWGLFVTPYDWQTTKLGLGLAKAYPKKPSAGDLRDLQLLGYENVYEVAAHALKKKMPVPLSLKPTLSCRIGYQIDRLLGNVS